MQKRYLAVGSMVVLLVLTSILSAQDAMNVPVENRSTLNNAQSYPVCGAPSFREEEQAALKYMAQHPELYVQMKLQKQAAWNFVVGSQKSWYTTDLRTRQRYAAPSTCRAVGTNCYIFVEDAVWATRVTQSAVDSVKKAFDASTPANASKGIFQTDVEAFGNPPNIDNDPKIIIFILDIKDQYTDTGSGAYTVGYFTSYDEQPLAQSNLAEMLYIDANPLNLGTSGGLQDAMATVAHEFQHMIHYNYDQDEITFVNEGCSLVAEINCGYPIYPQSPYINETNIYLFNWRPNDPDAAVSDYSRAARFMTYIRDQIGMGVFKQIVQTTADGSAGIDAALQAFGSSRRVNGIFVDWAIANALDDRSVNSVWGYTYPNLPKPVGQFNGNPNVAQNTRTVQNFGVEYVNYRYGANLLAKFTATNASLLIRAVELGSSSKRVVEVASGVELNEPDYGNTYQQIYFVVINTSGVSSFNYSYQSSGTVRPVELKWDETEPQGILVLSPGDTLSVLFNGIAGARLDSIRVALRRKGEITGGVWQIPGTGRSPLGKRLAFPFTAKTDTTPPFPYPVPFPGWKKVNLQSFDIRIDQPFAVGFIVGTVPNTPGVMITLYPSDNSYNSFTYLHSPSGGAQPNWYYLSDGQGNVYLYLIRAYASFPGPTGVRQTVELEPASFVLAQNYPNPFNPSTTIEFSLPKTGYVTLKVYDAMGAEISTLVAERRAAGKHTITWNAAGLPSGVYFYRLQGEGVVETKKLVLMK